MFFYNLNRIVNNDEKITTFVEGDINHSNSNTTLISFQKSKSVSMTKQNHNHHPIWVGETIIMVSTINNKKAMP